MTAWSFAPPRRWDRFRRGKKLSKDWQDIGYLVEEPAMPDNGERYSAWGEVPADMFKAIHITDPHLAHGDLVGMFREMRALGVSQEALDYALRKAFHS